MLESAAALVMVTDLEGHIARFNLACRRLSEYSFEEVEGKPVWDVLVPPKKLKPSNRYTRSLRRTTPRGNTRIIGWTGAASGI